MSLEQAINENTLVIKQLIAVMATAGEVQAIAGGAVEGTAAAETTGKRGRKKATDTAAETPTASAGPALNTTGAVLYFIIDKHNTAAAVNPGEVLPSIEGQRQVTQAEYEAYKAQIAAQFSAAQSQVAQTTVAAPAVSAEDLTMPKLTERLMAIHKVAGNDGVMKVLSHFKAGSVPALASHPLADVSAKIREVEIAHGLAQAAPAATDSNLFG